MLWARAIGRGRLVAAVVITLLYAAADEYHQTFVAGRNGTPVDWLIDAAGVAIAVTLVRKHEGPAGAGPS